MADLSVEITDPLIGTIINGRYEIQRLAETDELSKLYSGYDCETSGMVGIRVTETPMEHRRLHEWLGAAIMTRGRFAILAVGHFDRQRSYLVLSEAALTILRPRPLRHEEDDEEGDEEAEIEPCGSLESGTAESNAASAEGAKRGANVFEMFSKLLKRQSP